MENLLWLGSLCTRDSALQGGLMLGLFAAGAAGSVVHCGPMCGVFVLGQVSERMARLPAGRLCERQRISSGLLWPYHLGRLTTYATLGALAAGSAAAFGHLGWFGRLSAALLTIAALLFLGQALGRFLPAARELGRPPRFWGTLLGIFAERIPRGTVFGGYLLGVVLGLLPCGFLYAALTAAAASAQPAVGAMAMVAFGAGTAPALMIIGIAGQAAGRRFSHGVMVAAPVVMALNATLLLTLAWNQLK